MPRSPSPRRDRDRSRSPRRDRDRSRSPRRDRDEGDRRSSRPWTERRPKELSFYKKSSAAYGQPSSSSRSIAEIGEEETAKERAQRRERGEVPRRFGGTREQGVRNTMGNVGGMLGPAAGVGSFKRTSDPLDRIGVKGRDYGDRDRRDDRDRDHRDRRDDRDRDRRDYRRDDRDRDRDRDRGRMHPDRAGRSEEKPSEDGKVFSTTGPATKIRPGRMIEVIANDRLGRKGKLSVRCIADMTVRVKCLPTDTVGDLKKLIAAQTGTNAQKIILKKWYTAFKDHVQLQDYEINDGMVSKSGGCFAASRHRERS
ncbi:hypothetical protein A1Q1_06428 [Trichosporon asahii var. asahii CBS 2479]|uniref:Ubiquitin-like modifier HUB1 n=1 Tax=Trichosporon asahii var. asahii (strain ATCC 90039 / CBS 2479 / JCM 2466 / KCTC 7840 / NBRC 103889/ NCYC 2677 / UAMH 7654) TaxID=1186058 RepID=J5SE15_TRIAS|nr:hypothetical protein A1Q1_06428 [Trichosporon asahii var. asahii CBS 2479]EJT45196.1 hypothetical protein A1Q1_06428 [Trichosporon asahii var. asahii CBS 2479]